jgi:hypothetical protein
MPSGETAAATVLLETATNDPFPKVTAFQARVLLILWVVQVAPVPGRGVGVAVAEEEPEEELDGE